MAVERSLASLLCLLLALLPSQRELFPVDLDTILRGLLREERFRDVNGGNQVAIGFGSCEDVFADGLTFLDAAGIAAPSLSRHHDVISSDDHLAEAFAYFYEYGAAAERYMDAPELFQKWVALAKSLKTSRLAFGGNAPTMAHRFALEGWQVLLGATMNPRTASRLHPSIKLTSKPMSSQREDVHLVLEYDMMSRWGQYLCPRANRFIVHSDYSNLLLESLDSFIEALKSYTPSLVVVGGLQMLDNFPFDLDVRTKKLKLLGQLLASLPRSTKIHFEMASFTESRFLHELMTYVVPYADSLGMNEQELANLQGLIEYDNVTLVTDSNPRVATTLDRMRYLFNHLRVKTDPSHRPLTRIHVHTLAFQAILISRNSEWRNLNGAVAKASLTANRHVCASSWIDTSRARLIMDESFSVSTKPGSHRMPLIESSPVSCWSESMSRICVTPNLVCTAVQQTGGGGDNVSAAGLVLQL